MCLNSPKLPSSDKKTSPYDFAWNNGFSSEDIDSISSGQYRLITRDDNLCVDTLVILALR